MKLLASLLCAFTAHAGVLVQWDDGAAAPDPDVYFRCEVNAATYLRAEPPLSLDLPPGRYVIRIFAVNAMTGIESLPLEPAPVVLLALETSADLRGWEKVREFIEPAAPPQKFFRLRLDQ